MKTSTDSAVSPTGFTHLKRWERPSHYAGAEWHQWFVFIGRTRDSDCLTISNFECGLAAVKAASNPDLVCDEDEMSSVQIVHEGHWLVGWVEWIAIHESDTAALECAEELLARLESYPVLDEENYSQRETDEANDTWAQCYGVSERVEYIRKHRSQFEFQSFADMLGCVRGKYFAGYASELLN